MVKNVQELSFLDRSVEQSLDEPSGQAGAVVTTGLLLARQHYFVEQRLNLEASHTHNYNLPYVVSTA